jgi:hypothetical protein
MPSVSASFHFINGHPSSETEKSQTRHFVRSHIGRWISKQVKGHSGGSEAEETDDGHARVVDRHRDRADRSSIEVEITSSTPFSSSSSSRCSSSPTVSTQTKDWLTEQTTPGIHDGSGLALASTNSALKRSASSPPWSPYWIDYVGSGTLDPFQTYPLSFPTNLVNKCDTYC